MVVTANETGVNDLSLFLAVVTAMVRDGVIIVGGLIVVVVQRGFDFVVSFCLGSVQFGARACARSNLDDGVKKKS